MIQKQCNFLNEAAQLSTSFLSSNNKASLINIANFENNIITLLNKSVLSGEFYYDGAKILITKIENIYNEKISTEQIELPPHIEINVELPENTTNNKNNNLYEALNTLKREYLISYRDLIDDCLKNVNKFNDGLDAEVKDLSVIKDFSLIQNISEKLTDDNDRLSKIREENLFAINTLLIYIDDYLECDKTLLALLKNISKYLLKIKVNMIQNEVVRLLEDKVNFLQYKILQRTNHKPNIFSGIEESVNDHLILKANAYYHFKEAIVEHYNDLYIEQISSIVKKTEDYINHDARLEDIDVKLIHHVNRYYSRVYRKEFPKKERIQGRLEKVEILFNFLDLKITSCNLDNYNKIAYRSSCNLLFSNAVKLKIESYKKSKFETLLADLSQNFLSNEIPTDPLPKLEELYKRIVNYSNKAKSFDNYSLLVFVRCLTEFVDFLINNPGKFLNKNFIKDFDEQKLLVKIENTVLNIGSFFKTALSRLNYSYNITDSHKIRPIYLKYDDCIVPYTWEDGKIGGLFLDSSYILPNDFSGVKNEIISLTNTVDNKLSYLKSSFTNSIGQLSVQNTFEGFEKKVKENEFKMVQIVAMFVSIASFVLTSVKIFDNKKPFESFAILVGLAGCLILFNAFFYLLVLSQHRTKINSVAVIKAVIFSVIPIGIFASSFLLLKSENDARVEEIEKTYSNKRFIDSLFTYKIDSMFHK